MKIKLSKTLAVVLALCLTFAGFSAYAANVTITTSYNFTTMHEDAVGYDEEDALAAELEVNANITGIAQGTEVTYYVTKDSEIVYVNQDSADNGTVSFDFTTTWGEANGASVQFGSDAGVDFGAPFTITPAGNYKTNDDPDVGGVDVEKYTDPATGAEGWKFTSSVSGNANVYGVEVTFAEGKAELPAMGCDENGNFVIVVTFGDGQEVPANEPDAVAYAR